MWREPYNKNEKSELKSLIDNCRQQDVTFFYGISPGLDIVYSNPDDIKDLKAKLDELR